MARNNGASSSRRRRDANNRQGLRQKAPARMKLMTFQADEIYSRVMISVFV
jgi:hypothetical protein